MTSRAASVEVQELKSSVSKLGRASTQAVVLNDIGTTRLFSSRSNSHNDLLFLVLDDRPRRNLIVRTSSRGNSPAVSGLDPSEARLDLIHKTKGPGLPRCPCRTWGRRVSIPMPWGCQIPPLGWPPPSSWVWELDRYRNAVGPHDTLRSESRLRRDETWTQRFIKQHLEKWSLDDLR